MFPLAGIPVHCVEKHVSELRQSGLPNVHCKHRLCDSYSDMTEECGEACRENASPRSNQPEGPQDCSPSLYIITSATEITKMCHYPP